ncbi:30S ribosomal protein S8 [Candidatus Falkowbacteria bacterium HGW-Falkowbacteria-1]|uniref:Small ribosomal subunit protein uS8 n=1 Tax=Candidatus Falkowbacteria bacterium HGW-Falkowbacteria-1 TaxID=2013768 RepID=A0A2N2E995_9BACT|nr:MAG: 30S ribosomal protein S8 [Candidatus Falkowbacteria bacterium HGW-Falkowbacteria-1]
MIDPIADMLTRIRNASIIKKADIVLPMSKIKFNIAKILEKEGFISKAEIIKGGQDLQKNKSSKFDQIRLVLKYNANGEPKISSLKRISKPGRRVYIDKENIPTVLNGFGLAIISTSKGMMTNMEAKKGRIGGEFICEVY